MSKTVSARIDDTLHTMITDEANQDGKTVNEKLKQVLNNHFEKSDEKNEVSNFSLTIDELRETLQEAFEPIRNELEEAKSTIKDLKNIDQSIIGLIRKHEQKYEHKVKCSHSW